MITILAKNHPDLHELDLDITPSIDNNSVEIRVADVEYDPDYWITNYHNQILDYYNIDEELVTNILFDY